MSNSGRVIKGSEEPEGPFSRMSVEPVLIGADGEVKRRPRPDELAEAGGGDNSDPGSPDAGGSEGLRRGGEAGLSLAETREQAAAILELARQGAEDLRAEAEEYAARLRSEVEAEIEDRRAGAVLEVSARLTQEYAEQYEEAVHALADAAVELKRRRDNYLEDIEGPAYDLVLALGRRLLGAAWERDETLRSVLREALGLLRPEGAVRLYLHPATLERARNDGGLEDVVRAAGLGSGLELIADPGLAPAAYRLATGSSAVHFSLDEALEELLRRLQRPGSAPQEIKVAAPPPAAPDKAAGLQLSAAADEPPQLREQPLAEQSFEAAP